MYDLIWAVSMTRRADSNWTAVINAFLAPPLLLIVMVVANNKRIMGERVNGRWANLVGSGHDRCDVRSGHRSRAHVEQMRQALGSGPPDPTCKSRRSLR